MASNDRHQPPSQPPRPHRHTTTIPSSSASASPPKIFHPRTIRARLTSSHPRNDPLSAPHIAPKSNLFGPNHPPNPPFSSLHPVLNPLPSPTPPKSYLSHCLPCRNRRDSSFLATLFVHSFVRSLRESSLAHQIPRKTPVFGDSFLGKIRSLAPNSAQDPGRSAVSA